MKRGKKRIIGLVIFAVAVALIAGYIKFFNGTFLYISTGLKDDVAIQKPTHGRQIFCFPMRKRNMKMFSEAVCGVRAWKVSTWMTM